MYRRLSLLNGFAIIAVVMNHAAALGQQVIFKWSDITNLPPSINWDQLGSLTYYLFLFIRQIANFSVPSFFFVAGFFIVYALRGNRNRNVITARIQNLAIPYLIWFIVYYIGQYLVSGKIDTPLYYLLSIFAIGTPGPFWFIPLLCLFTILAVVIYPQIVRNWKNTLFIAFLIQLFSTIPFYLSQFNFPPENYLLVYFPFWSPLNSIGYFVLGMVLGQNMEEVKNLLLPLRRYLPYALVITVLFNIIESDFLIRYSSNIFINAYFGTFTFLMYATCFLFFFISLDRTPNIKFICKVGVKTYGIYLLHFLCMEVITKLLSTYTPALYQNQIFYQPLIIISGLGIPLAIMVIVERSPAKKYYRYLFS